VAEWQSSDDQNNREKINRARQAAEDLFKRGPRAPQGGIAGATVDPAAPTHQSGGRQPRIFNLPPRVPLVTRAETRPELKPVRRKSVVKAPASVVPASQFGRVRTLARYGMTPAQVAELYDAAVSEIERILKAPAGSDKSR
jgi:hypothetical protein